MLFEWDDDKDRKNAEVHGIDFETAANVFCDPDRIEWYDDIHSIEEDRYITIGMIDKHICVVTVVYTERGEAIRIISARYATEKERKAYYDCSQRD